jgi:hypothetical protein
MNATTQTMTCRPKASLLPSGFARILSVIRKQSGGSLRNEVPSGSLANRRLAGEQESAPQGVRTMPDLGPSSSLFQGPAVKTGASESPFNCWEANARLVSLFLYGNLPTDFGIASVSLAEEAYPWPIKPAPKILLTIS